MKNRLYVIGVSSPKLTGEQREILARCSLVAGGRRLLQLCEDMSVDTLAITPLDTALSTIIAVLEHSSVALLASGDPLFFGIGKRLLDALGAEVVEIHPALSSLQLACARMKIPWDDAALITLHGRIHPHIPGMLLAHEKTFIFTDGNNSPNTLAAGIVQYLQLIGEELLLNKVKVLVAENLGSHEEKVSGGSLQEIASSSFSSLNIMCLLCPGQGLHPVFGITEEEIVHSRGLITKDEIRAVSLHRLRLPRAGVFWDVGAGSGSLSIEAARMNPSLTIYAVERKTEELENIKANIRKFGCYNIIPVSGNAPDILKIIPDPDRVFIGGNGGQLQGIIEEAAARLTVGGYVVANGVIEKTITQAPLFMKGEGLGVTTSTVQFSRKDESGEVVTYNPITIIAGGKFA